MPAPLAHLVIAVAISTLVATAFNAAMRAYDRLRAQEMDRRAKIAERSIYDVPLIGACGKDRCAIMGAGR